MKQIWVIIIFFHHQYSIVWDGITHIVELSGKLWDNSGNLWETWKIMVRPRWEIVWEKHVRFMGK